MYRTSFTRLFDLDLVGFDGDSRSVSVGSDGALLFVAGFLHPFLDFGRRTRQGLLSLQRRLVLVRQSLPVFGRSGLQTSQSAKGALAWAVGGLDGVVMEVRGVSFVLLGSVC